MSGERGFTAGEVVRLTGIAYPNLDYWARSAFLVPSLDTAGGHGSTRLYSFRDVVAGRVAHELREGGISLQRLRKVVTYLQEQVGLDHPLAEARLVVRGDDVTIVHDAATLMSVLQRPGQLLFANQPKKRRDNFAVIVDLPAIVAELRERMAA